MNYIKKMPLMYLCIALFSNSINAAINQAPIESPLKKKLRQSEILIQLERALSHPNYVVDTLPYDWSDLLVLMQYSQNMDQPITYTNEIVQIYKNLIKGCPYIHPRALLTFLDEFPSLIESYFIPYKALRSLKNSLQDVPLDPLERLQQSFSAILYNNFTTDYPAFKQDPVNFLQELALNTFQIAQEEIMIQALRKNLIWLIDIAIGKLVFNLLHEPLRSWEEVKTIANKLTQLANLNIINNIDDLDGLFWSLVHRFCFFVDINGAKLSENFYETVKNDLLTKEMFFLDLEEYADFLQTKRDHLLRIIVLFEAQAKAASLVG